MLFGVFKTSPGPLEKMAMVEVKTAKELNQFIEKEFGPFNYEIYERFEDITVRIKVSIPFEESVKYSIKRID